MNRKIDLPIRAGRNAGMQTQSAKHINQHKHVKSERKFTDDEVNRLINKKFAKWNIRHQREIDELNRQLEVLKKENKAIRHNKTVLKKRLYQSCNQNKQACRRRRKCLIPKSADLY